MVREIKISNEYLNIIISSKGAELKSIIKDGKELLWQGDPDVWLGQAPVLFPICGGLKDDKYIFNGKEYILPKHGFARKSDFEVELSEPQKAVFLLSSNEESKKIYPFDHELRVTYTLDGCKLNVEYSVKNTSNNTMYFSIGAHEAYACPNGIEEYSIVFKEEENLDSNILNGNLLEYNTINIGRNIKELPLKYEYFAIDALVFLKINSREVSLKNTRTGDLITVSYDGADYLLLWTKPNAKYICIEPWCGIPDFVDSDYDFVNKKGIIALPENEICIKHHSILF